MESYQLFISSTLILMGTGQRAQYEREKKETNELEKAGGHNP
jgi:hypothetical protein